MKGISGFTGTESGYLSLAAQGVKFPKYGTLVWDYLFTKMLMFLSHAHFCSPLASLYTPVLLRVHVKRL